MNQLTPSGRAAPAVAHPTTREIPGRVPGRNGSCWCGSGLKYKRCHLDLDDAAKRVNARSAPAAEAPWTGKISEALITIARPVLAVGDMTQGECEVAIGLAQVAWNLAHVSPEHFEGALAAMVDGQPEEAAQASMEWLAELLPRALRYRDVPLLVESVSVFREGDGLRVDATSAPVNAP